ncbi:styrene monooxygenase/indole monooxygenase family protein [Saccharopolyspora mangrovi]|uniref:Styrene monooxygenase/indole monooxygenase family protein n=1 Tax=Saccharopolyspora mangrovi TaxID=3082379 RepID=A0ABU6A6F6_9PSEU|nr:styrene monooxygenase/indole monooxygenase family protein [Saccharopolyspora sp. S2-29]MEB3367135.1 styrene monooxygenase/indole monooxygenase family protein [Saccharopolyspora sp. S2-29]
MRKVLIVGAGQSGLQLALTLQAEQYDVTLVSAQTPEQIRSGRVLSTQSMYYETLEIERRHGLGLWDDTAPRLTGLRVSVASPEGERVVDWMAPLKDYALSIDQRVKMPAWLELFTERGGKVDYRALTVSELDELAGDHDLVVVAAGKGELGSLFERDAQRSPYTEPQRALSVAYVRGTKPATDLDDSAAARFNALAGIGEVISYPGRTLDGDCEIVLVEGVPGGPFDAFGDRPEPQQQWERMLGLLREHCPWEHERFADAELTDDGATLAGAVTPTVSKPIGQLPSGRLVLGMGDSVVLNDPVTGQGSNAACQSAQVYLESILERGGGEFDWDWMQRTFDRYWDFAQHVTSWANAALQPPPPHVLTIFGAATQLPAVGERFADGFAHPDDMTSWFLDPGAAEAFIAECSAA